MKNKKTLVIGIVILFVGASVVITNSIITNLVKSTNIGIEQELLTDWSDTADQQYILNENCKVVVTECGTFERSDNTTGEYAYYTIYNNYGKQIGCGYNPDIKL